MTRDVSLRAGRVDDVMYVNTSPRAAQWTVRRHISRLADGRRPEPLLNRFPVYETCAVPAKIELCHKPAVRLLTATTDVDHRGRSRPLSHRPVVCDR